MTRLLRCLSLAGACLLASAVSAHANARLLSVEGVGVDACVKGPHGESVQFWEVKPGQTYTLTIGGVFDCDNVAGDGSIGVRINSSGVGNTDRVAMPTGVPGEFEFTFAIPLGARCTMPIFYCTTPGQNNTGLRVWRDPEGEFQAHLRMATFDSACENPVTLNGGDCLAVPTRSRTWGQVKSMYR